MWSHYSIRELCAPSRIPCSWCWEGECPDPTLSHEATGCLPGNTWWQVTKVLRSKAEGDKGDPWSNPFAVDMQN